MKPHYEKKISSQEEAFTTFLESSKDVEWWFRNGEAQKKFFAIEYRDDKGKKRGFYVDYIVKLKNGRIGLFDPKSGFTANEAKLKAEALHKYIKAQKKKLFGGIFTFRDGSYRYNDSAKYSYDEQQLGSQWKYLDFSK